MVEQLREVVETEGDRRMGRGMGAFIDVQGLAEKFLGRAGLAVGREQEGLVADHFGEGRIVVAIVPLDDLDGAGGEGKGRVDSASVASQDDEGVEGAGDFGMVGAEGVLLGGARPG